MPLNEERALNQLGASAIFEIARANRSKRGLSQAGSSTGGATSGQTFLAAAVANSNAALALPMLTASEFRCPSSDKNGPAFFTSRPVGLDFPTLVGDPFGLRWLLQWNCGSVTWIRLRERRFGRDERAHYLHQMASSKPVQRVRQSQ